MHVRCIVNGSEQTLNVVMTLDSQFKKDWWEWFNTRNSVMTYEKTMYHHFMCGQGLEKSINDFKTLDWPVKHPNSIDDTIKYAKNALTIRMHNHKDGIDDGEIFNFVVNKNGPIDISSRVYPHLVMHKYEDFLLKHFDTENSDTYKSKNRYKIQSKIQKQGIDWRNPIYGVSIPSLRIGYIECDDEVTEILELIFD